MESSPAIEIGLPLALAFIMIGMGMSLEPADFKRVAVYPKAVILGLIGQIVLLPLIGFGVASVFPLTAPLAAGIVALAACPGGTTSNLIAHMARGNLALSITLTAFSSLITIASIPFIINLGLEYFQVEGQAGVPLGKTIGALVGILLIPTLIGMTIRHFKKDFANSQEKYVRFASAMMLVLLIIYLVWDNFDILPNAIVTAGPAALALNLIGMACGLLLGIVGGLKRAQTVSLIIEVGIQNSTLTFVIVLTMLKNSQMALPAAIYSLIMYITGSGIIAIGNYFHKSGHAMDDAEAP